MRLRFNIGGFVKETKETYCGSAATLGEIVDTMFMVSAIPGRDKMHWEAHMNGEELDFDKTLKELFGEGEVGELRATIDLIALMGG